jgi:hypothetical protein
MQAIFRAWNQSTPTANLPGWNDYIDGFPCFGDDVPWKGVLCLQYHPNITTISSPNVVVVGL